MDVRDIKEDVIYPGEIAFSELFRLQKVLLDQYVNIESLPSYPIDINTRKAQDLLKDFAGRIIEELGEGFESYLIMMDMFHRGISEESMVAHLQNFNEEVADALHFWLELLIYCGFETRSLVSWISEYVDKSIIAPLDLLKTWLELGAAIVETEMPLKSIPCRWVIKDHLLNDEFLTGGRQLGKGRRDLMKQYLWDIVYHLQIARNTLKNKPWKQTEMMTDEKQFENSLKGMTIALFKFLAFTGFTAESLYHIYYKKNKVNQFRIKSKY